jgi:hypothetical protein
MVTDLYFGIRLEPPTISLTIAHELAARAQRAYQIPKISGAPVRMMRTLLYIFAIGAVLFAAWAKLASRRRPVYIVRQAVPFYYRRPYSLRQGQQQFKAPLSAHSSQSQRSFWLGRPPSPQVLTG